MGEFIISSAGPSGYRFSFAVDRFKSVLYVTGYHSKADCLADIEAVRKHATDDSRYEKFKDRKGMFRFSFKADSRVIESDEYRDARSRDSGITAIKAFSFDATVRDIS